MFLFTKAMAVTAAIALTIKPSKHKAIQPMITIHQVIPELLEAEGEFHSGSYAMRGVLPETLQWYYDYLGLDKKVPLNNTDVAGLGTYMKANVTEEVAMEIARIKYFHPNGLDTLHYKEISSILLGIVYHLPSLATSVVGDALTRLGTPKTIYKDFETQERKRQIRLNQTWLAELNEYSIQVGLIPTYNAVHSSIRQLYVERGDFDDIENRLERVWEKYDGDCSEGYKGIGPEPVPEATAPVPETSSGGSGLFGGPGILITDHADNTCELGPLPASSKFGAWLKGWWNDLTGIQYWKAEKGVVPPFVLALLVLALPMGLGLGVFWWWKLARK